MSIFTQNITFAAVTCYLLLQNDIYLMYFNSYFINNSMLCRAQINVYRLRLDIIISDPPCYAI